MVEPRWVDTFRDRFRSWLDAEDAALDRFRAPPGDVEEQIGRSGALQYLLFTSGWCRYGWPEAVGGLGGSPLARGVVAEELTARGCPPPFCSSTIDVLGPALVAHGRPALASEYFPRLLSGQDTWCQGFSEPEAGSDLGSLRTRAVDEGDHWRVSGQKIWTSYAAWAHRCILLVRTGRADERFKGVTALFVDMDSPGITVRPLRAMTGDEEFAEMFLDDVVVPKDRTLGVVGGGSAITMEILANERSVIAWQRQAWLHRRLLDLTALVAEGRGADEPGAAARIGRAYTALYALRLKVRHTFHAMADTGSVGASTSEDKLLLSTAEKSVLDALHELAPDVLLLDDSAAADRWRYDWFYSRASSIYGGSAEIQRNLVAERVLALPRG